MSQKFKNNKSNKYAHNPDFAEEVEAKNTKQPAQNNAAIDVKK